MSDLKPCPFCGGEPEWVIGGPGCAYVSCKTCPAETEYGSIPRIAAAWNTRATPTLSAAMQLPEVRALVEAMERAIEAIDAAYDGPDDNGAYTVLERAALAAIKEPKT